MSLLSLPYEHAALELSGTGHLPVLIREVIHFAAPTPSCHVVDGTFGRGGYTRAFLSQGATVTGVDRDPEAQAYALSHFQEERFSFRQGCFGDLHEILPPHSVDILVVDLGVSSPQLDEARRGFSFQQEGPLDMRMSGDGLSAAEIIATWEANALANLFYEYGEERDSRRLARLIVAARTETPFTTTTQLAQFIERAKGGRRGEKKHPATQIFQALRMGVNDELGELKRLLENAASLLTPQGRLLVVTFHSLEDRLVKNFFREKTQLPPVSRYVPQETVGGNLPFISLTRKGIRPQEDEISFNPRARSATLRAIQKV